MGILLVALARQAAATPAPPAVRLTYERGDDVTDCPDRESVLDAVRARLGFDPFREPAEITIRASVFREGKELRARILWSAGVAKASERRLASRRADCAELASAMALALSIAIDPLSIPRESESTAPAARAAEPDKVAAPALDRSSRLHIDALAGLAGNSGETVAPAIGVFAGVGLRSVHWSLSLEGRADLPRSRSAGGGSVEAGVLAATFAPCVRQGVWGACALANFEALRGSGHDLSNANQATSLYFAAGARALVEVPLQGSVAVRAHADVASPLTRTHLLVGGAEVWASPPVSVTVGLAAVVGFQ